MIMRRWLLAVPLLTLASAARAEDDIGTQLVDALEALFGVHPGARRAHAKGRLYDGRFTPTAAAAKLSRAPQFAGPTTLIVRFSDAPGLPDIPDNDPIFHTLYDLDDRFQVPGEQYVNTGRTYEKDGYVPKWRAIRDDRGRVIVAICHNMHLGDAWEWSDVPEYPERFASMAFRIGLDYIIYGMTH